MARQYTANIGHGDTLRKSGLLQTQKECISWALQHMHDENETLHISEYFAGCGSFPVWDIVWVNGEQLWAIVSPGHLTYQMAEKHSGIMRLFIRWEKHMDKLYSLFGKSDAGSPWSMHKEEGSMAHFDRYIAGDR